MRVVVASVAQQELLQAVDFYKAQASGLAADLLEEIDAALEQIGEMPQSGASHSHGTRRIVLRRFPFSVVYRVKSDLAEVIAFAHQRREPGYWSRSR